TAKWLPVKALKYPLKSDPARPMERLTMKYIPQLLAALSMLVSAAAAHPTPEDNADAVAHYLANEGVMVVSGETKILFDPLFNWDVRGLYQLVPEDMRAAMMAGQPPYDGIDAVFVSHAHDDHFAAADMNSYLTAHPEVVLFAPAQAVEAMREAEGWQPGFEGATPRIFSFAMDYGDPAETPKALIGVDVEAIRIPHAGGPARLGIQNMVFRVTLEEGATVMHLGDAQPDRALFSPHDEFLAARRTHMAFVPDWFFAALGGDATREMLNAIKAVGVHVQVVVPEGLKASGEDYFSVPGETRVITIGKDD
ncbi:MAG: MBL fold metallo-hydrolase, partial [Pseudomonadota bacterium]